MPKIVTCCLNPTLDTNTSVREVVAERKLRCKSVQFEPGGGGINVSRALKKLNTHSTAIFTKGGVFGALLAQCLDKEKLPDTVGVTIENMTRNAIIILNESTNQQYRFSLPGPEISNNAWEKVCSALEKKVDTNDILVISGSIPEPVPDFFYQTIHSIKSDKSVRLVLDTIGSPMIRLMHGTAYLIKPNLHELSKIVDKELLDEEEQEKAACNIVKQGLSRVVVVSLGAAGVLLATEKHCKRLRAPTVPIRSKVGAGDSMVAGIVKKLIENESDERSVLYGIAAGSSAVMTPGTELCRKEDTEALYCKMIK